MLSGRILSHATSLRSIIRDKRYGGKMKYQLRRSGGLLTQDLLAQYLLAQVVL